MEESSLLKDRLKGVLENSFLELIEVFHHTPFLREEEVQWCLHHLLRKRLPFLLIQREHKTNSLYIRKNGKLEKAKNKVMDKKRSRGKLDLAVLDPEYSERGVLAGVELKYPRGKGKSKYLEVNLINDCIKLTDPENLVELKYLLCFSYNVSLPVKGILQNKMIDYIKDINFAYFKIDESPEQITIPKNWIQLAKIK